ncbi:hypothetical protein SAMN05444166_7499 [Singulisphaera sp. GP187]|uniref:hypothetical protein n=1 Tax=Singulisphaera sp. GP187 TaxID=1882752 RepID=UPI00092C7E8F|nr:hypothetical protein [Singulisphaera sp. GP187]SIO64951.1 hypothetical protein SAMN05444166_7499 [Singulisphaera sp. GP187]
MPEVKPVQVRAPEGTLLNGTFVLWDESPDDPVTVRLELSFNGATVSADSEEGYFDALCQIRQVIEPDGYRLLCLGASRGVYPSRMSRGMGTGDLAYKLEKGRAAASKDLVSIFSSNESLVSVTIGEQQAYFDEWLESLR